MVVLDLVGVTARCEWRAFVSFHLRPLSVETDTPSVSTNQLLQLPNASSSPTIKLHGASQLRHPSSEAQAPSHVHNKLTPLTTLARTHANGRIFEG